MSEEFTNQGLGESHSPETDKLALSITEMINAASTDRPKPAVEEKKPPEMPPELEKLLNSDILALDEEAARIKEEAPIEEEVPAEEESLVEEESPAEEETPVEEEVPAEEVPEVVEEPEEEVEDTQPQPDSEPEILEEEIAQIPQEEPDSQVAVQEEEAPIEEEELVEEEAPIEEVSIEEESPVEEATVEEESPAEEEVPVVDEVSAQDVEATDPEALFVKDPPADGSRYLLTPDTDSDAFRDPVAEICDNIRVFLPEKDGSRIIAVTSSGRGEGKSSFALILAMAFASSKKVLLADCDFESPQLHKYFNCVNKKGILNVAEGECRLDEVTLNTDMSGLKFVTAGMLSEDKDIDPIKVAACLGEVKGFDMVICDLPSLNKCRYASTLAGAADGAVIVARSGITGYPALEKALKKLKKADACLLGTVLNER